MTKVLVLASDYPNPDGGISCMYIHARNRYYVANEIDITVLNFSSVHGYEYDGVKVLSLAEYEQHQSQYAGSILVLHAANLRNHYRFLQKFGMLFERKIFFFHGHEVLRTSKVYPKAFDYVQQARISQKAIRYFYDTVKLSLWHSYLWKNRKTIHCIFVSQWMAEQFTRFVKVPLKDIPHSIIPNSIGHPFEAVTFPYGTLKKYDFITIRSFYDQSKYCVDIVAEMARQNSDLQFLLIGKGSYFDHYQKPDNLTIEPLYLSPDEILEKLILAKCALMPTRCDAQGVMACEMASIGMPLITSNIDVCHEVFHTFKNVAYIDNEAQGRILKDTYNSLLANEPYEANKLYSAESTIALEVSMLKSNL